MVNSSEERTESTRDKKEEARQRAREWRKNNLEYAREKDLTRHYKRRYGIDGKYVPKFGICTMCEKERRLCVDHCHEKGHIRGFICTHCNVWLGQYENKEFMEKVLRHLSSKIEVGLDGRPINE